MRVFKEKQFIVFCLDDGSTVKYDLEKHHCIGKKGHRVESLQNQLRGITMDDVISCCDDPRYGAFLRFVKRYGDYSHRGINNIGTILKRVKDFKNYEQFFAAGIEDIVDPKFGYKITDIPKALLKLCRDRHLNLSNTMLRFYMQSPDTYQLIFKLDYESLTDRDLQSVMLASVHVKEYYGEREWQYTWTSQPAVPHLVSKYGYSVQALMRYLDYLYTFEALTNIQDVFRELNDYCTMMSAISPKFEKYPKHFLTTHRIASRNYNRLNQHFDEMKFKSRIKEQMEYTYGDYCFIYPKSPQEIKDEAVAQNNCVASYIKRVMEGECDILFMRYKHAPDQSLVTIEVRNGSIVQAKQHYNHPVSSSQQDAIDHWNRWWSNKIKEQNQCVNENLEVAV